MEPRPTPPDRGSKRRAPLTPLPPLTFTSFDSYASMLFATLATLLITAFAVQANQVTQTQLTQVDQAYAALGFAAESYVQQSCFLEVDNRANRHLHSQTGFGLALTSKGLLTVKYSSFTITNGNTYTKTQLAIAPANITYAPLTGSATGTLYTLLLADAASLTSTDVRGNYRLYLAINVGAGADGQLMLTRTNVKVYTQYLGPAPLRESFLWQSLLGWARVLSGPESSLMFTSSLFFFSGIDSIVATGVHRCENLAGEKLEPS